ncbi:hypothetical protein COLO4_33835 [Corchorus olitorius]|uniref:Uncharacterized protein n=1 Tax=Corchorus olitorius TaxID=93759 RepID=A0A1R3GQT9_9ROSI|nr:hypothetical protein COLO4_33835 [Corchorus olitorius]
MAVDNVAESSCSVRLLVANLQRGKTILGDNCTDNGHLENNNTACSKQIVNVTVPKQQALAIAPATDPTINDQHVTNISENLAKNMRRFERISRNLCKMYSEDYGDYFDGGYLSKRQCHDILAKAYSCEPNRNSRILIALHRVKKGLPPDESTWKEDFNRNAYHEEIWRQA